MSPNAGRGDVKIVEPSNPSKAEELVGGLRNAFERGESFIKAKQSLINAGYNPAEVELAAQEMRKLLSSKNPPKVTPVETKPTSVVKKSRMKKLPKVAKIQSGKKQGTSKALMIVLVIIMVLILVGSMVLGLFWDQWF